MATAFGLPNDTPAFGYMRLIGFIAGIVGGIVWLTETNPGLATTLFWGGVFVGFLGMALSFQQRRHQDFEEHLADYEAGLRDDLPGDH